MITDQLITALCHMLMHSLWQGVILAAIAGGIIIATRRSTSALRYNLLIAALMLFAVGVVVTFTGQFPKTGDAVAIQPVQAHGIDTIRTPDQRPQQAQQPRVTERIENYLNDHRDTIILVWFLVICARSLQLGVGLYGTYRIRRIRVATVKDHWRDRMQQLARGLGISQTIALLESGLAKAPLVVGHLKPVILVPIGLLTALSAQEVEAILIHELAHVKRRDYLVNLLQSGMEIVFFFNPAVLWISKLIRTERENCCDDLAVAQHHSKANYIRALVSCEEYKAAVPPYAMAFPGGKNTLLHRVKRMANNRNHSLNLFEKTVLAVCLVGVGLFMTAFSATHSAAPKIQPEQMQASRIQTAYIQTTRTQTAPAQSTPTKTTLASTQSAPTPSTPPHPAPIPSTTQQPAPVQPIHPQSPTIQSVQKTDTPKMAQVPGGPIIPDLGDTLVKYNIIPGKFDMKARLNSAELVINGIKQSEGSRTLVYSKFLNDTVHSVDINYVYKDTAYNNNPYRYSYRRYAAQSARYLSDQAAIKLDLIKEGLVSDTNHISFRINEKEFVLNGVPQSPEVLQRYKNKFDPNNSPGWSWGHGTNRPIPPNN